MEGKYLSKGAFTYYISTLGEGGREMFTFSYVGGGGSNQMFM